MVRRWFPLQLVYFSLTAAALLLGFNSENASAQQGNQGDQSNYYIACGSPDASEAARLGYTYQLEDITSQRQIGYACSDEGLLEERQRIQSAGGLSQSCQHTFSAAWGCCSHPGDSGCSMQEDSPSGNGSNNSALSQVIQLISTSLSEHNNTSRGAHYCQRRRIHCMESCSADTDASARNLCDLLGQLEACLIDEANQQLTTACQSAQTYHELSNIDDPPLIISCYDQRSAGNLNSATQTKVTLCQSDQDTRQEIDLDPDQQEMESHGFLRDENLDSRVCSCTAVSGQIAMTAGHCMREGDDYSCDIYDRHGVLHEDIQLACHSRDDQKADLAFCQMDRTLEVTDSPVAMLASYNQSPGIAHCDTNLYRGFAGEVTVLSCNAEAFTSNAGGEVSLTGMNRPAFSHGGSEYNPNTSDEILHREAEWRTSLRPSGAHWVETLSFAEPGTSGTLMTVEHFMDYENVTLAPVHGVNPETFVTVGIIPTVEIGEELLLEALYDEKFIDGEELVDELR